MSYRDIPHKHENGEAATSPPSETSIIRKDQTMLINHAQTFRFKSAAVKTASALALLIVSTPILAHSADLKKTRYNVKFEKNLVSTDAGVEKVYALLEKKAQKVCRNGQAFDNEGKFMTKAECKNDMIRQFVENVDLAPVKAYHLAKLAEAKLSN